MAHDPEEREKLIRQSQPQDDDPVAMTHIQAMKCAAIVEAFLDGQELLGPSVEDVVMFLRAAAMEGSHGRGVMKPSTTEMWAALDELPWPPPGKSKPESPIS